MIVIGMSLAVFILRQGVALRTDLGKRIDDLGKRVDDLGKRVDDLSKRIDDQGRELGRRVDGLSKRMDDLARDMSKRMDDLARRLGTQEQTVAALKATVETYFRVRIDRPEPPLPPQRDKAA